MQIVQQVSDAVPASAVVDAGVCSWHVHGVVDVLAVRVRSVITNHLSFKRHFNSQHGSGLSLSIAEQLVKVAGGCIFVDSNPALARRTHTVFRLPFK